MNEIYVVLMLQGVEPKVVDVFDRQERAEQVFMEIASENNLQVWTGDFRDELQGTLAIAGDEVCSVQILLRTVHQ